MSIYLSTLDEQLEKLDSIIEELSNTHGGEKYLGRLREIANEMDAELLSKDYVTEVEES